MSAATGNSQQSRADLGPFQPREPRMHLLSGPQLDRLAWRQEFEKLHLMPHHGVLLGLKPLKENTSCEGTRSITLNDARGRQNFK